MVNVTRANHKAPKGEQTFTLTNGKAAFYDANSDARRSRRSPATRSACTARSAKQAKKCNGPTRLP